MMQQFEKGHKWTAVGQLVHTQHFSSVNYVGNSLQTYHVVKDYRYSLKYKGTIMSEDYMYSPLFSICTFNINVPNKHVGLSHLTQAVYKLALFSCSILASGSGMLRET